MLERIKLFLYLFKNINYTEFCVGSSNDFYDGIFYYNFYKITLKSFYKTKIKNSKDFTVLFNFFRYGSSFEYIEKC